MAGYEDFVNLSYKPKPSDLLVSFKVKVPSWSTPKRAYGAVASESSVGTWAKVVGSKYKHVKDVAGKVYHAEKNGWIQIAYPYKHFELGNMPQILASVAGNVFGMKAVDALRLQDIRWPQELVKSFSGPQFGIDGIRKIFKEKKRPLLLSVPKPKVGMTTKEHAQIGYDIWTGGLDLLKDDENLSNQTFNPFTDRVKLSLKMRDKAEKETGEKKGYLINVTSNTASELKKRIKFVADQGNEFVMYDICAGGWTGVGTVRELCEEYGLAIHAHRAFHGAFTRNLNHGMSMLVVAEIARLLGVDSLHVGTVNIGKLVGTKDEVLEIEDRITSRKKTPATTKTTSRNTFSQDFSVLKPVFPVSSGGLHPGLLSRILDEMGTNIMLQIGGGCHGHPKGSHYGALACRQAVDAYMKGIDVDDYAHEIKSKALLEALKTWGHEKTR